MINEKGGKKRKQSIRLSVSQMNQKRKKKKKKKKKHGEKYMLDRRSIY